MEAVIAGWEHLAAIPLPPVRFSKVSKGGEKPGNLAAVRWTTSPQMEEKEKKKILKSERTTRECL
jgi:hypothetical protein